MSLRNIIDDLKTDLYTYCSVNNILVDDKACLKFIITNKKIALKAVVDKTTEPVLKQFKSLPEMIKGTTFPTSIDGINHFIKVHSQFLESLAMYSDFDYVDLYKLIEEEN
ncbi:hypothetical protein ACWCL1_08185 [Ligilactobacillus sp. LYQ135]